MNKKVRSIEQKNIMIIACYDITNIYHLSFYNDVKNGVEIKETKYNKQLMNRFKYINLKIPTSETDKETFLNILQDEQRT